MIFALIVQKALKSLHHPINNNTMSFVFYIPSKKSIAKGWLFKQLLSEDQHSKHSSTILDETPLDEGEKLHRPGLSTRGVSIYKGQDGYEVSLHLLASITDWELAIKAAIVIAEFADDRLQPENYPEMSVKEFKQLATDAWISEQALQGVDALLATLEAGKGPVTLFGYRGEYSIGKNLIQQLAIDPKNQEAAYQKMTKHFTDHQNTLINYTIPTRYQLDGPVGGEPESAIHWNPEQATYLFRTIWVFITIHQKETKTSYQVKYNQLLPYLQTDSHFNRCDETNYLSEVFSEVELLELEKHIATIAEKTIVESANTQETPATPSNTSKPWWKLW